MSDQIFLRRTIIHRTKMLSLLLECLFSPRSTYVLQNVKEKKKKTNIMSSHHQVILHQVLMIGTYIKVGSSMFQDELSRVRLVLTVVHIHLELIGLSSRNNISVYSQDNT